MAEPYIDNINDNQQQPFPKSPAVTFKLKPPIAPMEALSVDEIPEGPGWQYEPKWDGFRCLVFRDGDSVFLQSKAEKPLGRYFPEVIAAVQKLKPKRFVLDGEIAVPVGGKLNFDQLLQRIHPAASRIEKLSRERPALFIVFDVLADVAESPSWPYLFENVATCSMTSAAVIFPARDSFGSRPPQPG